MTSSEPPMKFNQVASILLDTIVSAKELFDTKLAAATTKLNFTHSPTTNEFGRHVIFGEPLDGADWTIETTVTHDNRHSTDFRFELSVDHNTTIVEVSGTVDYAGTYGAELLRRTERTIQELEELKSAVVEIIDNLLGQVANDIAESRRMSDLAPSKVAPVGQPPNENAG